MGPDYTYPEAVSATFIGVLFPFLQFGSVTFWLLLQLLHVTVLMRS